VLSYNEVTLSCHLHLKEMYKFAAFCFPVCHQGIRSLKLHCYSIFVCFSRDSPQWARASSFTSFLDHTQHTTVGRTPLEDDQSVAETSTWQHTTLTTDRHPCPPVVFEPTVSAFERH